MGDDQTRIYTIGIIGGGKVGVELFRLFSESRLSRVNYVVDRDNNAPAIIAARQAKIKTYDDIENALTNKTDFVFEVTGSDRVVEILRGRMNDACGKLITHNMAFIILQAIEENNRHLRDSVIAETGDIKKTIEKNLQETESLIEHIGKVTSEMRMLALNARIEAARVGQAGQGFALVAEQMSKLTDSVREIARSMDQVTESVRTTSNQIEISLNRLK